MEAVTDIDDPGYEIVTEDKSTNCPSLNGSLKKPPKRKNVNKEEPIPEVVDTKTGDDVDTKASDSKSQPLKRWSKLMKYTLPSKNPETKSNKKNKERKSLKDKMKENELVAFLTERRAVSESRFRVLDKLGDSKVVKTKSEQSLDEAWNTGISSGTIKSLKQKFENDDEEIIFDLQSSVIVKDATSSTGDLGTQENNNEGEDKVDNETVQSSGSSNNKINETPQDSGNDDKKKDKKGKKKDRKKCDVCSSDKEHREHRREKRRIKKEKQERKKEKEASSTALNKTEAKKLPDLGPSLPAAVTVGSISRNLEDKKPRVTGDNFFQKLLMQEEFSKLGKVERLSRPLRREKKYVFHPSEPALGKYLKGKKAVSESKFKQFEEFEQFVERSLLPRGIIKCEEFNEKKSVFEGGASRPASSMGRPASRQVSPAGRPVSSMGGMTTHERPVSSMSNRSVSGDRRCFSLPRPGSSLSQARPGSSLSQASNSSYIIDQQEYKNYVYEMINSTPKNPRFNQLTQYFSTLERVTKLESESGSMEVHKLRSDDIVDFETWRQLRKQEKAKDELDELLFDLRRAQKEREFHFRPKEVESVRWSGDSRLRSRDKSVENLKNMFTLKSDEHYSRRSNTTPNKDVYKLYWRPKSVTDLTKESETSPTRSVHDGYATVSKLGSSESRFTTYPKSRNAPSPYHALTQQRSRSSLSMDQVSAIKHQLNEILSAKNSNASSVASSRSSSRADNFSVEVKGKGDPHPLQSLGLFVKPIPDVVRRSVAEAEKNQEQRTLPRSRSQEEEERKQLSRTINEELLKKVNFPHDGRKKKIDFDIQDTKQSPRTCHSLERDRNKKNHDDDFILVLSDGEQKNDEVEETLDKWASAGESEDEARIKEIRRRMKGRLSGMQSSQSSDSISSGTSIHTVIYKGGKNKSNDAHITESGETNEAVESPIKTISEITNEFEEKHLKGQPFLKDISDAAEEIPTNLVKEIRKSFENMSLPEPPTEEELMKVTQLTPPDIPKRTSSFRKQKQVISGSKTSLEKSSPQSKSACSISEKCADEGYATYPNSPRKPARPQDVLEKSYVPVKSISNVDLTDNEGSGLDETFGRMHEKVHSIGNSHDLGDYGFIGHKSLPFVPEPSHVINPNKYNRAYLTIAKSGDVRDKLMQFESKVDGAPLRSLPVVDRDLIRARATNSSKVVIKTQEVSDVNSMKQKLESYEKDKDLFDYCSGMLTKEKLKHFCKKVGHSKIITKMASLQKSANVEDDAGFKKLNLKASAETEYISKYRSGDVEQKKIAFENAVTPLDYSSQPGNPYFSWSNR